MGHVEGGRCPWVVRPERTDSYHGVHRQRSLLQYSPNIDICRRTLSKVVEGNQWEIGTCDLAEKTHIGKAV